MSNVNRKVGYSCQMSNRGQSLFEVVLAVTIVAVIIVGMVILATASIRNSSFARNKTLSTRYSQEAVEWLRGERDGNWTAFAARASLSPGLTWCLSGLSWPATAGSCPADSFIGGTIFKREVNLSFDDPTNLNRTLASIRVYWDDAQGLHEVKAVTNFTNWKAQ